VNPIIDMISRWHPVLQFIFLAGIVLTAMGTLNSLADSFVTLIRGHAPVEPTPPTAPSDASARKGE
jgi:hypothetical protein